MAQEPLDTATQSDMFIDHVGIAEAQFSIGIHIQVTASHFPHVVGIIVVVHAFHVAQE